MRTTSFVIALALLLILPFGYVFSDKFKDPVENKLSSEEEIALLNRNYSEAIKTCELAMESRDFITIRSSVQNLLYRAEKAKTSYYKADYFEFLNTGNEGYYLCVLATFTKKALDEGIVPSAFEKLSGDIAQRRIYKDEAKVRITNAVGFIDQVTDKLYEYAEDEDSRFCPISQEEIPNLIKNISLYMSRLKGLEAGSDSLATDPTYRKSQKEK